MRTIHDLPTPALLVDIDVLEENLRHMARRSAGLGVKLRPHVKTHKCVEIARAQMALGAAGITVSTLAEARVFADRGFDDLTWAFPLIPGRASEAAGLAGEIRFGVVVDCPEAIASAAATGAPFRVWMKVDCGYGRAGVDAASSAPADLVRRIEMAGLEFAGLLSHSGDAYRARSRNELLHIADSESRTMVGLASDLRSDGFDVPAVSVGSTPAMSAYRSLEGVTEVRPGNYALYDYTQYLLGSCSLSDCAATVLASVVSARPRDDRCVVDAGALSMSLDPGPLQMGRRSFGEVRAESESGGLRRNARLVSLSQEHGVLSKAFPIGSRLRLIPNHSCLTVACFDRVFLVQGEVVRDTWRVHRQH